MQIENNELIEVLYTDGGCSGNDQPDMSKRRMVAVVTDAKGNVLVEVRRNGGSNNIAELLAVKEALAWAAVQGWDAVQIRTDSKNNLAWIKGRIGDGVNDRDTVLELYDSICSLREKVHLDLVWRPRNENLAGRYLETKRYSARTWPAHCFGLEPARDEQRIA